MFTPKWAEEAKLLHKGAKKFLHYKRDLLKPDRIAEIEARRAELHSAIKAKDSAKAAEIGKQLQAVCQKALPSFPIQAWWEEQVEIIWVALVIALGLRTYVLQPFRIPTGSMQPTLNGITVNHFESPDQKAPNILQQGWEMATRGRFYQHIVATGDGTIATDGKGNLLVEDKSWFLFTKTAVHMTDGSVITISAAPNEAEIPFLDPKTHALIHFKKGDTILNGWIDTGDLVLVDKISYNFRTPKRGEVFVFDTRGLNPDRENKPVTDYIKRLCGLPGDTIAFQAPNLLVNGKIAEEPGIQRVMRAEGAYGPPHHQPGYSPAQGDQYRGVPNYLPPSRKSAVLADQAPRGLREYLALGDNTGSSLDSRFWGPVKEYNLVGPGTFTLWPFTTGHWGFIH